METIIITVSDANSRNRVEQALRDIEGVVLQTLPVIDEATLLAQTALADEWESDEDQRWDTLL
jgi:hypothetical protein